MRGIGVLALQGGFDAHQEALRRLGVDTVEVRRPGQLGALTGLIIPGGESTTLLRLLDREPEWWPELKAFHARGRVLFGTCAGLILLAHRVSNPAQRSLGLLDVDVDRNAYGRQIDSFEAVGLWDDGRPLEMVFIRAPKILRSGPGVETLARFDGQAVLVRNDRVLAATFHPELTSDHAVHRCFLDMVEAPASLHAAAEERPGAVPLGRYPASRGRSGSAAAGDAHRRTGGWRSPLRLR